MYLTLYSRNQKSFSVHEALTVMLFSRGKLLFLSRSKASSYPFEYVSAWVSVAWN